jgi:hypothetical protein
MKDSKLSERLKEVALLFLKLGAFSFGGPAVFPLKVNLFWLIIGGGLLGAIYKLIIG